MKTLKKFESAKIENVKNVKGGERTETSATKVEGIWVWIDGQEVYL